MPWSPSTSITRCWSFITCAALLGLLVGCAALRSTPSAAAPGPAQPPLLLLGEIHDNAAGHAQRLQLVDRLLAAGERPAFVFEQFNLEQQAAIDRRRLQSPPPTPDELIAAAWPEPAAAGWDWAHYRPLLSRALDAGLPIVAANVGRAQARLVIREGLAAHGFLPEAPADVLEPLAETIVASHCNLVDTALARRMALAQVARDQAMAQALTTHADRGALLFAGKGHVRRDVGVPRWLPPALAQRAKVVAVLEPGDNPSGLDEARLVDAAQRPDPCAGMRRPQAAEGPGPAAR